MSSLDVPLDAQVAELQKAVTALVLQLTAMRPVECPVKDVEHESVKARKLYAERRRREKHFGNDGVLFGEPGWDILLDLFIAYEKGTPQSVSATCIGACVPQTTALRWITLLEREGLVHSWPDQRDGRYRMLGLTPAGVEKMIRYLKDCP
ncbi:hypothetical protein [Sphingomonas sp. SORGH_AS_0879]|uniref:hypothetical protein n=1 Tax=Sphingomonas sp. SORGH_AS_0879 TaxID=3041790 RepID=UPI002781BCCA|nr:hypothetical protein [Sphingomonas sp. SORGH_AS_0879]MDQ1231712.1 DNA-binding MarR family transcriptional regulator [Sphingomonas sp. SORGH_AS_0879]